MDLTRTAQKAFTGLHATVYRSTGGRIGGRFGRAENVLLTTTGRKSGKQRVTPLVATPDGDRIVLIASNGGAQKHPDWYLNLTADPEVQLQRGSSVRQMRARTVTGDERDALWSKAVSIYKGYDGYQKKTARQIPVVVLEPH